MAEQNANSVAITGGTINGTTVGATTPAAGTFTTLTAQTEVLKGTGQNLVIQSQALATSPWSLGGVTATNNSATAPDSTNTASLLTASAGSSSHYIWSGTGITWLSGVTYTISFYAKTGTSRYVQWGVSGTSTIYVNFDTTAGTIGTNTGITTASMTNAGNGWYRCIIVFTPSSSGYQGNNIAIQTSSSDTRLQTWTAAGTETVYIWGVQAELGSTANTYIPTTTTAVYGTPTLSFSGVSTIGLESNGSLFVQPAGTGALQAQATTSSAVGGNARGVNAVDWQTSRGAASNVASGTQSVIGGGTGNTASGGQSVVVGGFTSTASVTSAAIVGGSTNTASGTYSFVGSGYGHTLSGNYGAIVGGYTNTSAGYYGFIGGGFTNSGTANSAVTTQSGTMNGTTAVTLSGSNANIKVGQLITGTSISFPDTYVAAISGTSLTLSKVATGSSTSTLSFFTPHGVVVGGGNNQATGSYSFIGGGGDAGTAANRNVASGDWSTVGGGRNNTASGSASFVGGGGVFPTINNAYPNTASGIASVVVGGLTNTASNEGAFVGAGGSNIANSNYSSIVGGNLGTTRGIRGNAVFPACQYPVSATSGVSQAALLILGRQTTDATPTVITSDFSSASTINQIILPNNSAYYFKGSVIANVTGAANGASWSFEGAIMRGANAASTVLIDTPSVNRVASSAGATAWVVALSADTTNGGLAVTVTGAASTTIRWVCRAETCEVTF
jgi:hypothetical protein